ncbi:N-acetyltransferase family protein [Alsobacter sp. R-9]
MAQSVPPLVAGIRRLGSNDRGAFREHLLRLDGESRASRFAMAASDAFVERYAGTAIVHDITLFGFFDEERLRAVAELRPVGERAAEAAFSVEPAWRGRGIATALFARIIDDARALGTRRIYMSCLSENRAMQALARKFEAEFRFEPADLLDGQSMRSASLRPAETSGTKEEFSTAIVRLGDGWRRFSPRRG